MKTFPAQGSDYGEVQQEVLLMGEAKDFISVYFNEVVSKTTQPNSETKQYWTNLRYCLEETIGRYLHWVRHPSEKGMNITHDQAVDDVLHVFSAQMKEML
jgi:hypothetical protein